MTHTVVMTLLALSLNGTPFQPKATRSHSKPPPPIDKPTPPPPQDKPPQDRPEAEEPKPEKPERNHEFDMSDVLPVIRGDELLVQSCYTSALARSPRLQGEVVVEFDIDASGEVEREKVSRNTTGDAGMERCILQLVRNWRFSRRDSFSEPPFHVQHPFRFQTL